MPKGQYQRRPVNRSPVDPVPPPDQERLEAAHEQAEAAVADLELAVAQELPKTDSKDAHIGQNVGVGNRQVAFEDGEYAVDPETGVVLKRL